MNTKVHNTYRQKYNLLCMYVNANCVFPVEVSHPLIKWSIVVAVNAPYVDVILKSDCGH